MSAPTTRDPLVVNTRDGVVWQRRAVTAEGRGLYAVTGSCSCPEFLMATLAELAAHGIAGSADVLPMPVGPAAVVPVTLSEAQVDALSAAGNRAVNDANHEDLCMCDAWPKECVSSGNYFQGYWDSAALDTAIPAVLALWESMRGGELELLRARVAELESAAYGDTDQVRLFTPVEQVRHLHSALAAQMSRADTLDRLLREAQARLAALDMQRGTLAGRMRVHQTWQRGRNPELVSEGDISQSALRAIFGIPLTAPWDDVEALADGITRAIAPVQALRDDAEAEAVRRSVDAQFPVVAAFLAEERVATEDPHDSPLHQTHRIGRDLPEMGGA